VIAEKEKYKRACRGDIAYNMMRMWQGAVGVAPVDGLISPAYIVARPMTETEPRYFTQLYCTDAYKNLVNIFSRGIVSDRNRLYWEDFKQIPTPFPPPDEQASIMRFLDHANGKIGLDSGEAEANRVAQRAEAGHHPPRRYPRSRPRREAQTIRHPLARRRAGALGNRPFKVLVRPYSKRCHSSK